MAGVIGVLFVLVFWRFIVIFGAAVIETAGLSPRAAGFESRSLIVGAGYTTAPSELVIQNPATRRVAGLLVVTGYFGPTIILALLGASFITPHDGDLVNRWVLLVVLVVTFIIFDRFGLIRRVAARPARALAKRAVARTTFETWIVVGDHAVAALIVPVDTPMAERVFSVLASDDIDLLAIEHEGEFGAAISDEPDPADAAPGDRLVVFGPRTSLETLQFA
jgi:hypothetical protein